MKSVLKCFHPHDLRSAFSCFRSVLGAVSSLLCNLCSLPCSCFLCALCSLIATWPSAARLNCIAISRNVRVSSTSGMWSGRKTNALQPKMTLIWQTRMRFAFCSFFGLYCPCPHHQHHMLFFLLNLLCQGNTRRCMYTSKMPREKMVLVTICLRSCSALCTSPPSAKKVLSAHEKWCQNCVKIMSEWWYNGVLIMLKWY
jgi:hypothetical protein